MRRAARERATSLCRRAGVLFLGLLFTVSSIVQAQYFGRNKVKYRDFDFKVLETEHFLVHYYQGEKEAATDAARMAERWYGRLTLLFGRELRGKQPLILYASHPEFAQTTALAGEIGQATGGVTEALKRRIILPMAGSRAETDHVIGHELVHAFQYDFGGITPSQPFTGSIGIEGLPLWMIEGMAEYYSLGARSALTSTWMRDAVQRNALPPISKLDSPDLFPYRWGHALWAFVGGTWGPEAPWRVMVASAQKRSTEAGILAALGVSADTLSALWHRALQGKFSLARNAAKAGDIATRLAADEGTDLDIGPALSPDGRSVLFLSSRDPYSIDLYLADVETGATVRRLTESALDPHYENLQFVNSAGAWAPDGERVALTTVSDGKAAIVVMRARSGDRLNVIELDRFGAVYNPAWSPDGQRIAFIANEGGYLDLWIVNAQSSELTRVTTGPEAELHPTWSPDGREIVVTTDRFGGYGLGAVSPSGRAVREIATYKGSNSTNPRFGPNGTLYFLSDVGGVPNLHRIPPEGGAAEAVTQVATGVIGLTELSPAFDVAQESGRIVFTAFENGHRLYRLDQPQSTMVAQTGDGAVLPPDSRKDGRLTEMLAEGGGLPNASGFAATEYKSKLRLDYVAPPTLGFAVGGYGTFVGGGIGFYFSDMLGYHELSTQLELQIQGSKPLNGVGGVVTYLNRSRRSHWGAVVGQIPQLSQAFGQGLVDVDDDGNPELAQQTLRFWEVSRQAVGLFQYPFSRNLRFELSSGFESISYDAETETEIFDLQTGERLDRQTIRAPGCGDSLSVWRDLCEPGTMNQFRGVAALVLDNSLVGPVGPIAGQRYRLEIAPSLGTLRYVTALADFRAYQRLASPLTLAGRVMHYGRYARDAEDDRLSRIFLGYPSLLRGYDFGSFDVSNCPRNQPLDDCSEIQVFDQLFGSRVGVLNAEMRLSLFGPVGFLSRRIPIPADLVGFFDAGVAWTKDDPATSSLDERPSFLGGDRSILSSAGVGLRFNLFGFALAEVHWVRPLDRPRKGSFISFALNTGF